MATWGGVEFTLCCGGSKGCLCPCPWRQLLASEGRKCRGELEVEKKGLARQAGQGRMGGAVVILREIVDEMEKIVTSWRWKNCMLRRWTAGGEVALNVAMCNSGRELEERRVVARIEELCQRTTWYRVFACLCFARRQIDHHSVPARAKSLARSLCNFFTTRNLALL